MCGTLQLHGLVAKGADLEPSPTTHHIVAFPAFDALVSDYALATDTADIDPDLLSAAAIEHHQILLAYCANHAVLPMRFGCVFSAPSALAASIETHTTLYTKSLCFLTDHREYSFHLTARPIGPVPAAHPATGRAFLSQKQHVRDTQRTLTQKRRQLAGTLQDKVAALSAQPLCTGAPKPESVMDVTALLSASALEKVRIIASETHGLAADLGLDLTIKGPWPAYHFNANLMTEKELCHGA